MTLLLTNEDVRAAVGMAEAIDALEAAFLEEAEGQLQQPHRLNMPAGEPGKSFLRIGPCVMQKSGWMGFKAMNLAKNIGVRYQVHLYAIGTGELCAIMDGQYLTTLRTGATSAVATKRLATGRPGVVGVLGSGQESLMQLEAMRSLGLAAAARIYSPTEEKRKAFAAYFRDTFGLDAAAVDTAEAAVRECNFVVAAVNSAEPVVLGRWLQAGAHVNSVGTARPTQRELDCDVFLKAATVVVDTRDGVFKEAGDCIAAEEAKAVRPEDVLELSQLVGGATHASAGDGQITLFKSVGTAVQDIGLAIKVYEKATAKGLGRQMGSFPHVLEKSARKAYH